MKRRGRGEGSIGFNQAKNLWVAALTIGRDARGKQRRAYVYAKTKTGVMEKMNRMKGERATGSLVEPSKITLTTYLTRWLEDKRSAETIDESTFRLYRGAIQSHILPKIGGTRLEHLTRLAVSGLLNDLKAQGVGAAMREVVYRLLSSSLASAEEDGLLRRNPVKGVEKPRRSRREMMTLTEEQAQRFLEAARADRYAALYAILLGTGLRVGEALGLTWPDVDFERKTVTVQRQLSKLGRRLKDVKTSGSRRTTAMPPFVVDALRQHQDRMAAEGHEVTDHLLVFVNEAGQPVSYGNLRRRSFHRLLTKVGLVATNRQEGVFGLRLHDLRHSFASIARRANIDIMVISRALGHSRPSTTWDVYSHITPAMPAEAATRLDAILAPKSHAGAAR